MVNKKIFDATNRATIQRASKKKIRNPNQFLDLVKEIINKGEKTLYLAIYNSNNQRSYITVKLK